MVKRSLIVFLILFPSLLFGQENTKVETDSSVIETKYVHYLNAIRVFNQLKKENKTYYTEYYYNNKRLREKGVFGSDGNCVGIWKQFKPNGKLDRKIDYDRGLVTYYDKKEYPFYSYQNQMKLMGDRIIKNVYSTAFFNKYVIWRMSGSYIYNDKKSGFWTDAFLKKPSNFLLRYDLKIDGKLYNNMIEFEINSKGEILKDDRHDINGLENLPKNPPKVFNLTFDKALEFAKQRGLVETDSAKAETFLYWEKDKTNSIYRGRFRYYVVIKTGSTKIIHPEGRSSITTKFDVYIFNPWTAEFLEKKKMKKIHSWEQFSGDTSGLLPDD